ncbi:uncharacterized protein LOC132697147 [Cylas formicarius]|uniref:uncharacterized protein LOC132697147 n=1 Tax=Cylas formicarius TaxID=197179 RepID=UPI0029584DC5|nr:uncharacterized protein LOC132697147 [Cylas formicarius]
MHFYQTIRANYGQEAVNLMKRYANLSQKIAKQKNRRIFLLRCKHDKLTPVFLNINLKHVKFVCANNLRTFKDKVMNKFVSSTLKLLITDTASALRFLEREKNIVYNHLVGRIPQIYLNDFLKIVFGKTEDGFNKIKQNNCKKIHSLKQYQNNMDTIVQNKNWVENLTNIYIPRNVLEIFSLGPDFAVPISQPKEIPIPNIISSIESALRNCSTDARNDYRSKCCNIIRNYKNKQNWTANQTQNMLVKKVKETQHFLKQNPNIITLKPDKTNKTVIMYTTDYDNKINELLSDRATYRELKNDPTNIFQKNNNDIINRWEKALLISPQTAKHLKINNAITPRIYGLPKLHKQNIPLRPIVSCTQSPFEKLSKFLKNILKNIVNDNEYYIKDSWQFKEKISRIILPHDHILASLDVVSLYTNIPIDLAIDIINKKWDMIKLHTDIPLDEFVEAIKLTLNSTYFIYNNKYYKQRNLFSKT